MNLLDFLKLRYEQKYQLNETEQGLESAINSGRLRVSDIGEVNIQSTFETMVGDSSYQVALNHLKGRYSCAESFSREEDIRPFTLRENCLARVIDFNRSRNSSGKRRSFKERISLWAINLDSCDGIIFQDNNASFKVIIKDPYLLNIPDSTKKIREDYEAIEGPQSYQFNYNQLIPCEKDGSRIMYSQDMLNNHPLWLTLLREDKDLWKEYRTISKHILKKKRLKCVHPFALLTNTYYTRLSNILAFIYQPRGFTGGRILEHKTIRLGPLFYENRYGETVGEAASCLIPYTLDKTEVDYESPLMEFLLRKLFNIFAEAYAFAGNPFLEPHFDTSEYPHERVQTRKFLYVKCLEKRLK